MAYRLLVTLKNQVSSKTLSFDEAVQSAIWLGMDANVGADNSIAHLELHDGRVVLSASKHHKLSQPAVNDALELEPDKEAVVSVSDDRNTEIITLYIRPVHQGMRTYRKLGFFQETTVSIGRAADCGFAYMSRFVSSHHAELSFVQGRLTITDLGSSNGTLVNGVQLQAHNPRWLAPGDVVEILDLTIGAGSDFITVNEPSGLVMQNIEGIGLMTHGAIVAAMPDVEETDQEPEVFYPAPRLSKSIHPLKLHVDDPPSKKPQEDQPVIMQIGPSFLMGLSSVFMVASSLSRVAEGAGFLSVAPSVAMAVAMIGGSVVWPIISRGYTRRKDERDEARRGRLYISYLDGIENSLANEAASQAQILEENRRPVGELMERASVLSPMLMNHTSVHTDFMDLRVGVGDADISAEITWPQHHFSLADDRMLDAVDDLSKRPPLLRDIPLAFNPAKNFIAGIIGERATMWEFLRGLLIQVCSLYSYQDVKIVMVSTEDEMAEWDFLTHLGHLYDPTGTHRYVALTYSGMISEGLLIEHELEARAEMRAEVLGDYGVYYIIVCSNLQLAKKTEAITRLLKLRENKGFSLIYMGDDLSDLPRECGYIVDLNPKSGANLGISLDMATSESRQRPRRARMFARSDVQGTLQQFDPDIMVSTERARDFALSLARARLDVPEQRSAMPDSVGFLEMFQVGSVGHLNIGQRWAENDASQSLQTWMGADEEGEHAVLDLHEDIHGPHGLIAGTTGSGKSEFIITYVLSMCVNYAPDEVAFVLIDYKGGGLAGAFENERHHLPHLAGTITNLDGGSIKRSLVSIQSELKRRQDLFNQARDITGEATMDIYKYLSFYRQGVLTEPLPHLFIVADEFAELKQQEPEFMDELISAARIGRSLGVHLILATQKPSGVVNDQIWSNARFKVCLKVSDAGDSREMIHRDDAADITQAGRYYLLVGYNESFSTGQAAYAGLPYVASESFEVRRDNAVELLDAEGNEVTRLRPVSSQRRGGESELNAVLSQIEEASRTTSKQAQRLWLDPLPPLIPFDSIRNRYELTSKNGLNCFVGEIDDPDSQRQYAFEVDIVEAGNMMLYGTQNSDVDGWMRAIMVSLASEYDARKLWLYAIDYGSGALVALEGLPQFGGIVLSGDTERLGNLFRMLEGEMQERRKLLSPYGGSIDAYNAREATPLARIVVGIANLASFQELNPNMEDRFVMLTRDAPRYGIHVIATAATANTPRMRLRSNFGMEIPTMLNDQSDYVTIFGSLRGVTPPQQERRGIVRKEKRLLEFQGMVLADEQRSESDVIGSVALRARALTSANARPIPQLPAFVGYKDMHAAADGSRVPVGYSKMSIEPVWHNLEKSPYMLVLGNDEESLGMYLRGLRESYAHGDAAYRFIDTQHILGEVPDPNVLSDEDRLVEFIDELDAGASDVQVIIFTSVAQTISGLPTSSSTKIQDYIAKEKGSGKTSLIVATELWRVRSIYADWYKVVSSSGNGIWVGGGFSDQSVYRFARSLPEYRQPADRSDAFYVMRGNVVGVRLIEASDEPRGDDL